MASSRYDEAMPCTGLIILARQIQKIFFNSSCSYIPYNTIRSLAAAPHHCSSNADPRRSSSIHLRSIDHRLVDPPIIPRAPIVASSTRRLHGDCIIPSLVHSLGRGCFFRDQNLGRICSTSSFDTLVRLWTMLTSAKREGRIS
jgi:hypothetical protein